MTNDPYGLTASGIPPELQAEYRGLTRQQALQEALLKQGMAPGGEAINAGKFIVRRSPLEGIAKILQAYMGQRGLNETDAKFADLGKRHQDMTAAEIQRYMQTKQGIPEKPAIPMPPEELGGGPERAAIPAVAGDPRAAMTQALLSRNPMLQKLGALDYTTAAKAQEPFTLPQGAQRRGPDGKLIAENPPEFKPDKTFKAGDTRNMRVGRHIVTQEYQPDGTWKEIAKGDVDKPASMVVHNPPPITAVTIQDPDNPNGTIVIDGRTRQVLGKGPKLTDTGKMEGKRQFNMQGIGATIQEAEDLLTGKGGKALPTGSGVGTVVDAVAGFVGASPTGAKEAQTLKAVGGALVSKMPRMEGPQSDKDVALYKEMAGVVGDSTVPRERRIAALDKVKELWAKYERINPDAFSDRRAPAAPGAVVDFNSLPK